MSTQRHDYVWVFNGEGARFPSGVFSSKEKAAQWIQDRKMSGVLTAYPIDEGAYEWAIRKGFFSPKSDKHTASDFVQRFTSAGQEHIHYEHGEQK